MVGLFILLGDYDVREALGLAFWVAFVLHTLMAEAWIRYTRGRVPILRRAHPATDS